MLGLIFQFILIAAFPAIFVGCAAAFSWQQLGKKWLFVAVGLVILYVTYVAVFYLLPSATAGYTVMEAGQASNGAKTYSVATHKGELNPSFISQYVWQLLLFTMLAIPSLWFLVKALLSKHHEGSMVTF